MDGRYPSLWILAELATVKCQAIGWHATMLFASQSDMSRWKYRWRALARRVFLTLFARSKSVVRLVREGNKELVIIDIPLILN
ncbi:MAG TPA: hypothetical protein VLK22_01585 [Candidatus Udaeobacter sp.]|nr:hypothetical protein [Candidatus Udaeobacter sp.]